MCTKKSYSSYCESPFGVAVAVVDGEFNTMMPAFLWSDCLVSFVNISTGAAVRTEPPPNHTFLQKHRELPQNSHGERSHPSHLIPVFFGGGGICILPMTIALFYCQLFYLLWTRNHQM